MRVIHLQVLPPCCGHPSMVTATAGNTVIWSHGARTDAEVQELLQEYRTRAKALGCTATTTTRRPAK